MRGSENRFYAEYNFYVFILNNSNFKDISVEFSGSWTSSDLIFNYDTDMDAGATARAFAKEPWNQQYFKDLEK